MDKAAATIVFVGKLFSTVNNDDGNLLEKINGARVISGFPSLENIAVLLSETDELKRQCISALTSMLDKMCEEFVVSLFNQLVEIDDFQCFFVDELMAYYELRTQETQGENRKDCNDSLDSLISKCNFDWLNDDKNRIFLTGRFKEDFRPEIESFIDAVRKWDKIAQPLLVNMQKYGGQHEQSKDFILEIWDKIAQTLNDAERKYNSFLDISKISRGMLGGISSSASSNFTNAAIVIRRIIETMEEVTSRLIEIFSELEMITSLLRKNLTIMREMKSQVPDMEAFFSRIDSQNTSDGKKKSRGCYIATCVYGSYDCPEVWTLRRYRDYHMSSNLFGRAFIKIYYRISPALVKRFGDRKWFKGMFRFVLDRVVRKLNKNGYADTPYEDFM